jgi:hypothetical protein
MNQLHSHEVWMRSLSLSRFLSNLVAVIARLPWTWVAHQRHVFSPTFLCVLNGQLQPLHSQQGTKATSFPNNHLVHHLWYNEFC